MATSATNTAKPFDGQNVDKADQIAALRRQEQTAAAGAVASMLGAFRATIADSSVVTMDVISELEAIHYRAHHLTGGSARYSATRYDAIVANGIREALCQIYGRIHRGHDEIMDLGNSGRYEGKGAVRG